MPSASSFNKRDVMRTEKSAYEAQWNLCIVVGTYARTVRKRQYYGKYKKNRNCRWEAKAKRKHNTKMGWWWRWCFLVCLLSVLFYFFFFAFAWGILFKGSLINSTPIYIIYTSEKHKILLITLLCFIEGAVLDVAPFTVKFIV